MGQPLHPLKLKMECSGFQSGWINLLQSRIAINFPKCSVCKSKRNLYINLPMFVCDCLIGYSSKPIGQSWWNFAWIYAESQRWCEDTNARNSKHPCSEALKKTPRKSTRAKAPAQMCPCKSTRAKAPMQKHPCKSPLAKAPTQKHPQSRMHTHAIYIFKLTNECYQIQNNVSKLKKDSYWINGVRIAPNRWKYPKCASWNLGMNQFHP